MKHLLILAFTILLLTRFPTSAHATYNPLSVPNNKLGVHILSPDEVSKAAELVNSNGGDWGYITVPIQPTDRDQEKWQTFLDKCTELHLIPIIRITTIPQGGTWATGQDTDLVDFANFLNDLSWPIQNRYIVLFNEVNRAQEWGGQVNPIKYARIVKNARSIFQERNSQYFLLGPALDTALPESDTSMTAANYLKAMEQEDPAIWSYFDGWASHSYPNPNFSAAPAKTGWQSIVSYRTETSTLKLAPKPIFITETGWAQSTLSPSIISSYWKQAWTIWNNDQSVAAVTPFVLEGGNQFRDFSLYSNSGALTASGNAIKDFKKASGQPLLNSPDTSTPTPTPINQDHTTRDTAETYQSTGILLKIENFFRRLFGLLEKRSVTVAELTFNAEVATQPKQWEQGLSGRESLASDTGLLFVFPRVHSPVFWMKNMNFPIDIIWIRDGVISHINHSVPVPTNGNLETYSPPEPVDMVLETIAGFASANGLKVGDHVVLHN